jgi:hypothetical protein
LAARRIGDIFNKDRAHGGRCFHRRLAVETMCGFLRQLMERSTSMRTLSSFLLVVAATFAVATSSYAQQPELGAVVKPKGDLPLRDAPPSGFLGLKGDVIGTATPDKTYKVIDAKSISTFFGGENWIKLQNMADQTKVGWVYSGTKDVPDANIVMDGQGNIVR